MGLFDFVKDAGEKIFGGGGDDDKQGVAVRQRSLDVVLADKAAGEALKAKILKLDDGFENLRVSFREGLVTLSGAAPSQAVKEKAILVAGNTAGVARVDDRMTVAQPEPEARMYTVVSGDSLSRIAKQFYGDAEKYPLIFEANRPMLKDPNKIYPGQVLRIPPVD